MTRHRFLRGLSPWALLLGVVGAVKNAEIIRTVDLSGPTVRMVMSIRAEELAGKYVVSYNAPLGERLAFLRVKIGDPQTTQIELPYERIKDSDGLVNYEVKVSGSSAHLQVEAVFTEALKPYPEEIFQRESQLVMFEDSHYAASQYPTASQTSYFKLASPNVESFTRLAPSSHSANMLTMGPYKDVDAKAFSEFKVHYENNAPFPMAKVAIREIEVSHWGNVAHEEYYEVVHAGAKLKGGFSRHDYQFQRVTSNSFRTLYARLPRGARDIYYRDQIGNISSSELVYSPDSVELSVDLRFPLFGGWKTVFYQGYNVPIQAMVTHLGSRFTLTVPFSIPYDEMWAKDLTVKIVLPEHARDVQVNVPFEVQESRTSRLTYLDTSLSGGRPVLILKKGDVVAEHNVPITVTYTFRQSDMLWEPMYLVLAFFVFYLICMAAVRLDLNIGNAARRTLSKEKSL